jgi:hypothetical protein
MRVPFPNVSVYRKDFSDLCASGDVIEPGAPAAADRRPLSRSLPPRIFGVLAQKAQMYIDGIVRCVMPTHWPWTYSSHDSLATFL